MYELEVVEGMSSDELLEAVKIVVSKLYGKDAEALIDHIAKNGYVAEENLASDTGIRSNEGRRILQKISEEALVVPDKLRVENAVLHVWKLNSSAVKTFLLNRLRKAREKLEILLKSVQENAIYECPKCGRKYTLEVAYAQDFTCPNDREVLVEVPTRDLTRVINDIIKKLDNAINKLEQYKANNHALHATEEA